MMTKLALGSSIDANEPVKRDMIMLWYFNILIHDSGLTTKSKIQIFPKRNTIFVLQHYYTQTETGLEIKSNHAGRIIAPP